MFHLPVTHWDGWNLVAGEVKRHQRKLSQVWKKKASWFLLWISLRALLSYMCSDGPFGFKCHHPLCPPALVKTGSVLDTELVSECLWSSLNKQRPCFYCAESVWSPLTSCPAHRQWKRQFNCLDAGVCVTCIHESRHTQRRSVFLTVFSRSRLLLRIFTQFSQCHNAILSTFPVNQSSWTSHNKERSTQLILHILCKRDPPTATRRCCFGTVPQHMLPCTVLTPPVPTVNKTSHSRERVHLLDCSISDQFNMSKKVKLSTAGHRQCKKIFS